MAALFFAWLAVCFTAYFIRSAAHASEYKRKRKLSEKHYKWIGALAFIYWFAWFSMVFLDPYRASFPDWTAYAGLALFIAGTLFMVLAHVKIKGFEDKGYLHRTGLYAKIRHPMYLGFSLWVIGLPMFTQSLVTLATAPIWIVHMIYWAIVEEKELEKKHPEYKEYKTKTWF